MNAIKSARFLAVCFVISVIIFILDILFHGQVAPDMYVGYPQRPQAEMISLMPFLFATYVVQLTMYLLMFICIYPKRGIRNAVIWGLWGGLFVVIPNMQFFVAVKDTSWTLLGMQVIEGVVLLVIAGILLELMYRIQATATVPEA